MKKAFGEDALRRFSDIQITGPCSYLLNRILNRTACVKRISTTKTKIRTYYRYFCSLIILSLDVVVGSAAGTVVKQPVCDLNR